MPSGRLAVWYEQEAWEGICTMQEAKRKRHNKELGAFVLLILVISTVGVFITLPRAANAASLKSSNASKNNVATNNALGGTGATLPYVEMEAHSATTNGTIIGPSYTLGDLASDAVDRQAVQLTQGQYVAFTLPQSANSINLRYSIPDSSSGCRFIPSLHLLLFWFDLRIQRYMPTEQLP